MNRESQVTSQQRRPDWAALVIAAVLVAMAAVIFFDVARLNETTGYSQVGPATVPHWIAYVLVGLGIWTVFAAFRRDFPERERQEVGPVVWVVAGLVAQMVLIRPLGFSIATGVLFGLAAAGFGARRIWISIPVGIVICLGIYWLFAVVLQLSLPAGPLEHLIH
ncbi:tripartite tricarboxylate transporter TctB family protein [Rhizobium sp. 16-449-1b]|uniref:tripartite tricarboxylate transporter TctB family protein n=1 Tax=Rhizobium sp. 16-449-1b TaxID=2819989 RepID=UPI001ADD0CCC|nr:tripartite tricarboxylate transporter TctB family protein [Rhizobium sp. 16-449-1b]MBO9197252.1 tripartite tricarboxylate transporter TctB family protein [Rhizobium sp. 16-449-1b]